MADVDGDRSTCSVVTHIPISRTGWKRVSSCAQTRIRVVTGKQVVDLGDDLVQGHHFGIVDGARADSVTGSSGTPGQAGANL